MDQNPHAELPTNHLPPTPSHHQVKLLITLGVVLSSLLIILGMWPFIKKSLPQKSVLPPEIVSKFKLTPVEKAEKFKSVDDFKKLLQSSPAQNSSYSEFSVSDTRFTGLQNISAPTTIGLGAFSGLDAGSSKINRYSQTNVQVVGIDEPDIVKTNGQQIFYSDAFSDTSSNSSSSSFGITSDIYRPYYPQTRETRIFTAFPPSNLSTLSKITENGNLLLSKDQLVVFTSDNRTIKGYSVKDPSNPASSWTLQLSSDQRLLASRLKADKLYVITSSTPNQAEPCPYSPLSSTITPLRISCSDIYYPTSPVTTSTIYTIMAVDINSGQIKASTAFVASSDTTVIYVSPEHIYLTYGYEADLTGVLYDFFSSKASDLVSTSFTTRLKELASYNLSSTSKMMELTLLVTNYQSSLSGAEKIRFQNEMQNRLETYLKEHSRELEFTGIAKFDLSNLNLTNVGRVSGHLLNQFSLDEYKNNLRVATTLEPSWIRSIGGTTSIKTFSDVYVLNNNLDQLGSVQGLGETEKIYSVRFVDDRGYVVTFRQVDPFYVLDLSNPSSPRKTGELKIPGYSSYLHPIGNHKLIGVGKDGSYVKVSLFDASDPTSPKELSKYSLSNEYWSESLTTHHAFLEDSKYQNFFIPGSSTGYVISYAGDTLILKNTVTGVSVRRAVYISDYLYILATSKIVVVDQKTGQTVKELVY